MFLLPSADIVSGTVALSYVNLFLSIRKKAIEDCRLPDWEDYWLRSESMEKIWSIILTESNTKLSRGSLLRDTSIVL